MTSELTRDGDEVLAVLCEPDAGDELGVSEHGGHALAGVVVVDGDGLVGARGRRVDAAPVERNLDQRPVVAVRALERPGRKGWKMINKKCCDNCGIENMQYLQ